jgi:hypothetical protein
VPSRELQAPRLAHVARDPPAKPLGAKGHALRTGQSVGHSVISPPSHTRLPHCVDTATLTWSSSSRSTKDWVNMTILHSTTCPDVPGLAVTVHDHV